MNWAAVAAVGRFQPFHWGHFEYLVEAAQLGSSLVVGITNPAPDQVRVSATDSVRSSTSANPFDLEDRVEMISETLQFISPHITAQIVPCDLRTPDTVRRSLGRCDVVALTIYDAWGEEKAALVEEAGYRVHVLWRRADKLVSGTEVRRRLEAGEPWDHLVPAGTARVVRRRWPVITAL